MPKSLENKLKTKLRVYSRYLFIGLTLLLIFSLAKNVTRIKSINKQISEKQEDLDKLEEENKKLKSALEEVKSDNFVEKQLRDSLGLAKEGEIVVVLPDEEILRSLAPSDIEEEETLPDPNWKKWAHLFGL